MPLNCVILIYTYVFCVTNTGYSKNLMLSLISEAIWPHVAELLKAGRSYAARACCATMVCIID